MPAFHYSLVDVFASRPLEGNLLAVIHDADEMDDETMATLARRFRLSETSFLQSASSPSATYRHRIFIVDGEIPFAGHPSLGAAAVWVRHQGLETADVVQQTVSGEQRIRVELASTSGWATIWQNPAIFGEVLEGASVLAALGLPPTAGHAHLPVQVMSTGLPTLVVPVSDVTFLADLQLDSRALGAVATLADGSRPLMVYVVADVGSGEWRARSFGTDLAGGEDPATGSAAGPFGAYLKQRTGIKGIHIVQGLEMGCPSDIHVDCTDGVVVRGEVQFAGEGTLTLPD